jgi:menaquinone-9 beta-reductase
MRQKDWAAVVVGAGLAGSTAAWRLADQGIAVILLEKTLKPHNKLCGEFLSADAQAYLGQLGLNLLTMGGIPITHVRLCAGQHQIKLALPDEGLSLSRYLLDEALLSHAEFAGVTVKRGTWVKELIKSSTRYTTTLTLQNDTHLHAENLWLATGKTDLPGQPPRPTIHPDYLGLKMYFQLSDSQRKALQHTVEVMFFDQGSYAGLQPVENGLANLCMVIHKRLYRSVGNQWLRLLKQLMADSPVLTQRLAGAEAHLTKPLAMSGIPYGFVYHPTGQEWFYRLGDQLAVIPSFCGQGMAMALHTAFLGTSPALTEQPDAVARYYQAAVPAVKPAVKVASKLFCASQHPATATTVIQALSCWPNLMPVLTRYTRLADSLTRD